MAIDTAILTSSGAPVPFGGGGVNNYFGKQLGWTLDGGSQMDVPADSRFFTLPAGRGIQLADGFYIITARMLAHARWTAPTRPDPRSLVVDCHLTLDDMFGGELG